MSYFKWSLIGGIYSSYHAIKMFNWLTTINWDNLIFKWLPWLQFASLIVMDVSVFLNKDHQNEQQ